MDLSVKLKAIRRREGLTQLEFCALVDISISSYKKYETDLFEMGYAGLCKVLTHPTFTKYTLWLMTGHTAPECGQVSAV
jgi:transcriptional regulator with XRE-family HTH domain